LLAAFTFHRGVIASHLPYFREWLQDNATSGQLFSPNDGAAPTMGILDCLTVPMAVRTGASQKNGGMPQVGQGHSACCTSGSEVQEEGVASTGDLRGRTSMHLHRLGLGIRARDFQQSTGPAKR